MDTRARVIQYIQSVLKISIPLIGSTRKLLTMATTVKREVVPDIHHPYYE